MIAESRIFNRCIGVTKNNKKCRAKIRDSNNYRFFCCNSHLPINKEIIENGCFLCMEKIKDEKELLFFNCKHLFHQPCYLEWLKYSTYENPICLICRKDIEMNDKNTIKKTYKKINNNDYFKIINIQNILCNSIYKST
jgi:hypothetical protein